MRVAGSSSTQSQGAATALSDSASDRLPAPREQLFALSSEPHLYSHSSTLVNTRMHARTHAVSHARTHDPTNTDFSNFAANAHSPNTEAKAGSTPKQVRIARMRARRLQQVRSTR